MNATARRSRATRQIRDHPPILPTARPMHIQKVDIRDIHLTRVRRAGRLVDVEVALIQNNRSISVLDVNVLVGDVVNVSVADVWPRPSFQARAVLAVEERDVFEPGVGDVVFDAGVLADGSHGHAVRAVAPEVLHEDVGRVGLGAEAVVAHVDACVGYGKSIHVERVEAVGIFGEGLVRV